MIGRGGMRRRGALSSALIRVGDCAPSVRLDWERAADLPTNRAKSVVERSSASLTSNARRWSCSPAIRKASLRKLLVLVHGFDSDMIAGLVSSGLAMARRENMKAGGRAIEVVRFWITGAKHGHKRHNLIPFLRHCVFAATLENCAPLQPDGKVNVKDRCQKL